MRHARRGCNQRRSLHMPKRLFSVILQIRDRKLHYENFNFKVVLVHWKFRSTSTLKFYILKSRAGCF